MYSVVVESTQSESQVRVPDIRVWVQDRVLYQSSPSPESLCKILPHNLRWANYISVNVIHKHSLERAT